MIPYQCVDDDGKESKAKDLELTENLNFFFATLLLIFILKEAGPLLPSSMQIRAPHGEYEYQRPGA